MKLAVFKAVFLLDVLKHTPLLQPCPVKHRLAAVQRQAHLQKPVHQFAAEETVHPGLHPAPESKIKT